MGYRLIYNVSCSTSRRTYPACIKDYEPRARTIDVVSVDYVRNLRTVVVTSLRFPYEIQSYSRPA